MSQYLIQTPRLRLREIVPDDLDFLAEMLGDAEVMRYYPKVYNREESRGWLDRQLSRYAKDGYGLWLVESNESGEPVGQVGLINQTVEGVVEPEIGYLIHRPFWKQGYATEAASAVRDYALEMLGKTRLISLIRPANVPSQRTALKIGSKPEKLVLFADLDHIVFSQSNS